MRRNFIPLILACAVWLLVYFPAQAQKMERRPLHRLPTLKSAQMGIQSANYTVYHTEGTLVCSDCHTMHASMQHDFAGGTEGVPYSGGANPKLLKANDPVYVCLACHDGRSGIPDVLGADVNGLTERAAGFFDQPNTPNYRGHNLGTGLNLDTLCDRCHFVGEMATASVSCIDCHNPHGNGKARNLQWASWPGGEPDFGMYLRPGVTGLAKYERANEGYGSSA